MAAIRAGSLNRRVTIQQRAVTLGTYGEQATTWTDIATVWACMEPLSGRELQAAQQLNAEVTHQVMVRYQTQWTDPKTMAKYRLVFAGRNFDIHASYCPEESRVYVVILCSEGLNQG